MGNFISVNVFLLNYALTSFDITKIITKGDKKNNYSEKLVAIK